jgi:hypothetical protein
MYYSTAFQCMILFCHGNNCIALYNEIRPQFDFLDRVDIFYQIIFIYKKLSIVFFVSSFSNDHEHLNNKYIVNVHQKKSVYLI